MSREKRRVLNIILCLCLVFTLAFIWGNSLLDGEQSSQVSNGLLESLKPLLSFLGIKAEDDYFIRKLAHFCEFALLGVELATLALLNMKHSPRLLAYCAASSLFAAAVDEGIQYFTGRYSNPADVLLDFCGAAFGIMLVSLVLRMAKPEAFR